MTTVPDDTGIEDNKMLDQISKWNHECRYSVQHLEAMTKGSRKTCRSRRCWFRIGWAYGKGRWGAQSRRESRRVSPQLKPTVHTPLWSISRILTKWKGILIETGVRDQPLCFQQHSSKEGSFQGTHQPTMVRTSALGDIVLYEMKTYKTISQVWKK